MKESLRILLILVLVLVLFVSYGFQPASDPVLAWIRDGDIEKIETWLVDHNINTRLGDSGITLLVYSIIYGDHKTTSWLLEHGADIEAVDPEGNTPLFYAAKNQNPKIVRLLIRKGGADVMHRNESWQTAYDMAVKSNNPEVAAYLRSYYEKHLPDYRDGPYARWKGKRRIKAFYLVHDSQSQSTRKEKARYKADSDPYNIKGFAGDTLHYRIHSTKEVPADLVGNAEKLMVIGDIHGGYDSLILFLQNNGVINSFLKWIWGNGHLVFVGDIFDRGERVTEALWLIYQLEEQAKNDGGGVHLVLGNHEILVLSGDLGYVADKYKLMASKLNIDYSYLFSKKTVLGQWLRTKNTITRINGHLFVHAGLSPDLLELGLDIHEINAATRYFLNHPDKQGYKEINRSILMGVNGPFWYRGYIENNHDYELLHESEFEKVLEYFDARYIFVGHTNVKEITPLYHNRVFAIDVPFYTFGNPIQGLLLKEEKIFMLNSSAVKTQLK